VPVPIAYKCIEAPVVFVRALVVVPDGTAILNEIPAVAQGALADEAKIAADLEGITTSIAFDLELYNAHSEQAHDHIEHDRFPP